jgi:DNA (cytosine-5)-methyltransferase 3A
MKLLIGGSPCTHWSIAQTKNRETEASGIGWELFLNYRIARDKYKPDFFLYENNKSMSPAIRAQITAELGVEPVLINSALVSAQNRQRLYWVGKRNPDGTYSQVYVEQPEDRGILLQDILETGIVWQEKSYCIAATEYKGSNPQQTLSKHRRTMVAEPVRIGTIENDAKKQDFDSQQYRVYPPDGKSVTLCGQGGGVGAKTGLYAVPVRVGAMPNKDGELGTSQSSRIYSTDGKSVSLKARPNGGGADGASTGLYAVPVGMAWRGRENGSAFEVRDDQKSNAVAATGHQSRLVIEAADGKQMPVYEVRGGRITIKGKTYPTKLADGFYIIRKLTVRECMRLQTVPEKYVFPVSATQAYKMLGNGWTVDVTTHIMSHFTGLTEEPVEVLSMYDGMSCGHIALDKLGAEITAYYATEIDKYAIQTTQHNYPDTVQLGDAFQVRDNNWRLGEEL